MLHTTPIDCHMTLNGLHPSPLDTTVTSLSCSLMALLVAADPGTSCHPMAYPLLSPTTGKQSFQTIFSLWPTLCMVQILFSTNNKLPITYHLTIIWWQRQQLIDCPSMQLSAYLLCSLAQMFFLPITLGKHDYIVNSPFQLNITAKLFNNHMQQHKKLYDWNAVESQKTFKQNLQLAQRFQRTDEAAQKLFFQLHHASRWNFNAESART